LEGSDPDMFVFFPLLLTLQTACAFQIGNPMLVSPSSRSHTPVESCSKHTFRTVLAAEKKDEGGMQEYKNAATSFLANFMQKSDKEEEKAQDPLGNINFDAPKVPKMDLEALAIALDGELYEKEWFVTGQVNPSYFADDFEFQDPDVKLSGIEGARALFVLGPRCKASAMVTLTTFRFVTSIHALPALVGGCNCCMTIRLCTGSIQAI
jgi:hypothetical protein